MLNLIQKKIIQTIVNIFETGQIHGDYQAVTVLKGDPGRLTYGRSQASLASGNLTRLLKAYCDAKGSYADQVELWLPALEAKDPALDTNRAIRLLLKQAGADPVMKKVQDEFFDRMFWLPASKTAAELFIHTPLGVAIIYDSFVHGSFQVIRRRNDRQLGPSLAVGEEAWIRNYIGLRREWLTTHANEVLRRTVYRMDAFHALMEAANWALDLPLTVRDVYIEASDVQDVSQTPPAPLRVLEFANPHMAGEDVIRLQKAVGIPDPHIDGIFGPMTDLAVRAFQRENNLVADGKVGPQTWHALQTV